MSPIRLGVCAMPKKANCKPMKETLGHFDPKDFEITIFTEAHLFSEPIEQWPICDALIVFYSTGFPQAKAEQYVALRKPFLVNDLVSQRSLRDRRKVFKICQENQIPVPLHICVNRDGSPEYDQNADRLIEGDGYLEIDGVRIEKPFVEKPGELGILDIGGSYTNKRYHSGCG
jgi:inositol hexakisphosphate/diphosphoinositol-pentakisphosphate kinase